MTLEVRAAKEGLRFEVEVKVRARADVRTRKGYRVR